MSLPVFALTFGSFGDIVSAIELTIKITRALYNRWSSTDNKVLNNELKSLLETLDLAARTVEAHSSADSDLGQKLILRIYYEVSRCNSILREFWNKIEASRGPWVANGVGGIWSKISWAVSEADEVVELRRRLATHRDNLNVLFLSLNFVHVNQLMQGGFEAILGHLRHPSIPKHITDKSVIIEDILGRQIPIPLTSCGSWQTVHNIIAAYFKDKVGSVFVERGDYHLLPAGSDSIIDASSFPTTAEEGMRLEMSVVLKKRRYDPDLFRSQSLKTCPRCQFSNHATIPRDGWIDCESCAGRFHVAGKKQPISTSVDTRLGFRTEDKSSMPYFRRIHLVIEDLVLLPDSPDISNWCRADYDYTATTSNDLSFHKGDVIEILSAPSDGWWFGLLNSKSGCFPCNFVTIIPRSTVQPPYVPALCRASYDYSASEASELSFREGDVIEVIGTQSNGWWDGLLNGERGWFPCNYMTIVPHEVDESQDGTSSGSELQTST